MKTFELTGRNGKGFFTLVDDEDYEKVKHLKWHITRGYARTTFYNKSGSKNIRLHRLILNVHDKREIDHINGNKLDNRKENLRIVTRSQNETNKKKFRGTSIYKGVCWNTKNHKYQAYVALNYKLMHIGFFEKERHAAMAYDIWAKELFGEYARLNFASTF